MNQHQSWKDLGRVLAKGDKASNIIRLATMRHPESPATTRTWPCTPGAHILDPTTSGLELHSATRWPPIGSCWHWLHWPEFWHYPKNPVSYTMGREKALELSGIWPHPPHDNARIRTSLDRHLASQELCPNQLAARSLHTKWDLVNNWTREQPCLPLCP